MNLYEIAAKKRGLTLYNQDGSPYDGTDDHPIGIDSMGNEVLMPYGYQGGAKPNRQDSSGPEGVAGFTLPPSRSPQDSAVYGVPPYLDPRMPAHDNADPANWFGGDLAPYRSIDMQSDDDTKDATALMVPGRQDDLNVPLLGPRDYLRSKLLGGNAFSSAGVAGDSSPVPPGAKDTGKNQKPDTDTDGSTDDSEGDDQEAGDDDDSGDQSQSKGQTSDGGLDETGHIPLQADLLAGDESDAYDGAVQKLEDYQSMMDNGGPGYEVDWGPALALIDSWTGSHLLPGYQHPARPLSPDERARLALKTQLDLYKTISDARQSTLSNNLRAAATNLQTDQSKALYSATAAKNKFDDQTMAGITAMRDQLNAAQKAKGVTDPMDQFYITRGGQLTTPRASLKGKPPMTISPDDIAKWNQAYPQTPMTPNGKIARQPQPRQGRGAGPGRGAARPPKVSSADINQAATAAYYARTGNLPDKTKDESVQGLQGYKNKLLKMAQTDPVNFSQNAQALIHGEANTRWAEQHQGQGAGVLRNAPDQEAQ